MVQQRKGCTCVFRVSVFYSTKAGGVRAKTTQQRTGIMASTSPSIQLHHSEFGINLVVFFIFAFCATLASCPPARALHRLGQPHYGSSADGRPPFIGEVHEKRTAATNRRDA